jgi:hypothetical protein
MNRNVESHFALNPTRLDMSRSKFDRSFSLKTSFNVGDIVPFYVDEVLPGDTFDVKTSKVVRMQTLITPIMDNIYLDTYYFFVPNRLVWEHWKQFNGENTESAWLPSTEYSIPQLTAPSGGWSVGTIADYMGIPTGVANLSVSALPFRAYALICNEWFRDENLCDPLVVPTGDATVAGSNTVASVEDYAKGATPYKAAKYHDYFTSCLPAPQKGPDVMIGLSGEANVFGNGYTLGWTNGTLTGGSRSGSALGDQNTKVGTLLSGSTTAGSTNEMPGGDGKLWGIVQKSQISDPAYSGLIADLSTATSATINQLRLAFQIQKLYEKDARGGTRYTEILKTHFGVTSPDSRLQRPEYLGGNRVPININQVVQNSATVEGETPLGNVAGYSVTSDTHSDFRQSFTEHGFAPDEVTPDAVAPEVTAAPLPPVADKTGLRPAAFKSAISR